MADDISLPGLSEEPTSHSYSPKVQSILFPGRNLVDNQEILASCRARDTFLLEWVIYKYDKYSHKYGLRGTYKC